MSSNICATLKSPVVFLIPSLFASFLFFFEVNWTVVFLAQVVLLLPGLAVRSLRLISLVALFLSLGWNLQWFWPTSECKSEITELTGRVGSGRAEKSDRLSLIQLEGRCENRVFRKATAIVSFNQYKPKKLRYFRTGDRIGFRNIEILREEPTSLAMEWRKKTRMYNESDEDRRLARGSFFYFVQAKLDYFLDGDRAGLFKALVLGDRWGVSKDLKLAFQDLGIAHLFAISGLHVGIIYLWVGFIIRWTISFSLSSWVLMGKTVIWVDSVTLIVVYLYLDMIGMPITAFRAWTMIAFWLAVKHFLPWQSIWMIFVSTAMIILAENPLAIKQLSFQLSFLSVFAILLILPFLPAPHFLGGWWSRVWRTAASSGIISGWLILFSFPLVANVFGKVSLGGIVNNLVHISILSWLILPLGLFLLCATFLQFHGLSLPGEIYIYSMANVTGRFWEETVLWNQEWMSFAVWEPSWKLDWSYAAAYWTGLAVSVRLLGRWKESRK